MQIDDVVLAEQAVRCDVLVTAGRHWFPAEAPAPFLRLSYAGAHPTTFAEGVHRLAELGHFTIPQDGDRMVFGW